MEKYYPPFKITNEMLSLVASIMEKIGKVDSFNNLDELPILRKQNRIKSIHSSCAIEANSLSFDQVQDVINGINVVGPQKDIIEVQNAIEAYKEIENINPFDEEELKRIHFIFGKNVVKNPGKYRSGNEGVSDENGNIVFVAPQPNLVPIHMSNLFSWIKKEFKTVNPLILSSVFHYEFVFIHPFSDGNGRTVRFWQNAILGKWKPIFYWLPIENKIQQYQEDYYKAISMSHLNGESTAFIVFMLKMIDQTFSDLLSDAFDYENSTSIYIKKLLESLKPYIWYTSNDILKALGLKSKEALRKNYLGPAIKKELIILEFPDKPTSKNQRYKLVR
ncbi:MAG: Fic family protein [Bacilli bacterium]|nr:Fic family protein [Bacilli bacterium]